MSDNETVEEASPEDLEDAPAEDESVDEETPAVEPDAHVEEETSGAPGDVTEPDEPAEDEDEVQYMTIIKGGRQVKVVRPY